MTQVLNFIMMSPRSTRFNEAYFNNTDNAFINIKYLILATKLEFIDTV